MQDRTGLTVFLVRVVFVLFETRRFCKVARFVFPDLAGIHLITVIQIKKVFLFSYNFYSTDCETSTTIFVIIIQTRL